MKFTEAEALQTARRMVDKMIELDKREGYTPMTAEEANRRAETLARGIMKKQAEKEQTMNP